MENNEIKISKRGYDFSLRISEENGKAEYLLNISQNGVMIDENLKCELSTTTIYPNLTGSGFAKKAGIPSGQRFGLSIDESESKNAVAAWKKYEIELESKKNEKTVSRLIDGEKMIVYRDHYDTDGNRYVWSDVDSTRVREALAKIIRGKYGIEVSVYGDLNFVENELKRNYCADMKPGEYSIYDFMEFMESKISSLIGKIQDEKKKIEKAITAAKESGEKQELHRWEDSCDGSIPECTCDIIVEYIDADGMKSYERIHTY